MSVVVCGLRQLFPLPIREKKPSHIPIPQALNCPFRNPNVSQWSYSIRVDSKPGHAFFQGETAYDTKMLSIRLNLRIRCHAAAINFE